MSDTGAPPGSGSGGGTDGQGPSRRALLTGAVSVAGLALTGFAAKSGLVRVWDHERRPRRVEGAVDYRGADWFPASSANWRRADRPHDYGIDRVVIHVVQGSYDSALKVFQDPGHDAASHYVVRRDGHIAQAVREADVAYQAGNRSYNEHGIGIEHEGFVDRADSFTSAMYAASARLTADICRRYDIPVDREHIIGHVEVPGTDHTDPGPLWDWDRYMRLVRAS